MWNTSNPAELYSGTTWELLATDKYLKTTTGTPLSSGGSNSFTIQKTNLPATKLQVESFSLTNTAHTHQVTQFISRDNLGSYVGLGGGGWTAYFNAKNNTSSAGGQNTGTASPSTEILGNGTSISVNPTYITIRAWKRLT